VEFDNLADFGRTAIVTLPINGELITRATLVVELPDIYTPQINAINQQIADPSDNRVIGPYWAWTNSIGHAIIAYVDFMIDGAVIDSFDSQLLEVLDEQTTPVEHFDSTDSLIARDPSSFSDQQTIQTYNPFPIIQPQTNPQTLEIVIPFWWNRGPGPQALPIQALSKDKVQIRVTFRPVQQCVYTSARINAANPPLSGNQGAGPLPNIAGCGFFVKDASSSTLIYDAGSTDNLVRQAVTNPFKGRVLPGTTMPTEYHFTDAYWIVEYVSLEDREATAFRLADLEIPIEQHVPLPPIITGGSPRVRIRMDQGGLVRDLTWVAQRVEAPSYNAHFLFSKDLAATGFDAPTNPCDVPWWPNALIPNWNYGDGYVRPGDFGLTTEGVVSGGTLPEGDCDDADALAFPGATEDALATGLAVTDLEGDGDPDLFIGRADLRLPQVLVSWAPASPADADRDGVPDAADTCPDAPDPLQADRDAHAFACTGAADCAARTGCTLLAPVAARLYWWCGGAAATWADAGAAGAARGASLVQIDDPDELRFLRGAGVSSAGLGLSDIDEEGSWRWADGSALAYARWGDG
jgi:hypothetical protein